MRYFLLILFVLFISSCRNAAERKGAGGKEYADEKYIAPAPGTVIAADSVIIPDPLNELYFSVKIITNEYSGKGTYDIVVLHGYRDAVTQITFPKTDRYLQPVLKRVNEDEYVVGFHLENDTSFYDYYSVLYNTGSRDLEMKYLKAYSFE